METRKNTPTHINRCVYSSLVTYPFLFVDRLANLLMKSTDTEALTTLGDHVLLDETSELTLLGEHRQECRDELVVVVCPPAVVYLHSAASRLGIENKTDIIRQGRTTTETQFLQYEIT